MSKNDKLKLRKIDLASNQNLKMSPMSYNYGYGSSGSETPIDGGSLKEIEIWGSSGSSGNNGYGSYNSAATCHRCRTPYDSWGMCPYCDYGASSGWSDPGYGSNSGSGVGICAYCGGQLVPIPGSNMVRCSRCATISLNPVEVTGSGSETPPPSTGGGGGGVITNPPKPEDPKPENPKPEEPEPEIPENPENSDEPEITQGDCVLQVISFLLNLLGCSTPLTVSELAEQYNQLFKNRTDQTKHEYVGKGVKVINEKEFLEHNFKVTEQSISNLFKEVNENGGSLNHLHLYMRINEEKDIHHAVRVRAINKFDDKYILFYDDIQKKGSDKIENFTSESPIRVIYKVECK